ncbi:MAG: hypothetical protein J6S34_02145 [Clostridia bacterium]|nr:hypothetical protein [Clostridia bacterium]
MELQQALANLQKAKLKQKKLQKRTLCIAVPIGVVLGLLIVFAEEYFFESIDGTASSLLVGFVLTLPLQLIIHELGHLVFGLSSGYRFVSFRVFSLAFYKKDGKLRFGRYRVPGTIGQCLLIPSKDDDSMPYRALLLGGVLFNSIATILFVIPFVLCYSITFLRFFSLGMIFWGIAFAMGNGIPQKSGAAANDGYHAKILPTDSTARSVFFNQLRISAAMTEGKRLAEMPKEWFSLPKDSALDPLSASLAIMEAEREMDLARLDAAEEILVDLANRGEDLPEPILSGILSELLYLEMVGKHRRDVIETLRFALDRYFKVMQNSFTYLRIEISYHYLFTGDINQIQRLEKKFEKLKKHFPFTGEVVREELLIAYPKALYHNWRNASHS